MKCPNCKAKNRKSARFCGECGADLQGQNLNIPQDNDYNDEFENDKTQTEFFEDLVTKEQLKKAQHATRSKVIIISIFSIIIIGLLGIIAYLVLEGGIELTFLGESKQETTVAQETTVEVTEKTVSVPGVAGYNYNLALQRLSNVNLKVTYTYEYSDNISQDCVISQTPDPGAQVAEGTEVKLVLSKGRENAQSSVLSTSPSEEDSTDSTSGSSSSGNSTANSSDFIIPESSSRYVTYNDVKNMDEDTLELARNEIYARHGRKFRTDELQRYFYAQPWYRGTIEPEDFDESVLNEYERANVSYLLEQQRYVDDHGHASPNL